MNKIEQYLSNFSSPGTIRAYRSHLKNFFNAIDADPETYFDGKRDYEADVQNFWNQIKEKPPMTRNSLISAVNNYLLENDIQLPRNMIKKLKKRAKGDRPLTIDDVPTPEQLRHILQFGRPHAKAIFLIAASSGMRINEILHLLPADIDLNYDPPKINVRGEITKTGQSRITFMSYEAKEALEAWLRIRDDYLKSAIKRLNVRKQPSQLQYHKDANDPRIFPIFYDNTRGIWNRMIRKAGYEKIYSKTGRRTMHIHCLRKMFRVYAAPKATADLVELLMGHEDRLSNVYRNHYPVEKLAEMYKKAIPDMSIYGASSDERINEFKEEMKEKDKQISELEKRVEDVDDMKMQLLELRLTIQEMKNKK